MSNLTLLKKRLFSIIGGVVILFMVLSMTYSASILKIEKEQEVERDTQTLRVYMQRMEESMDSVENLLITQCSNISDIQKIRKSGKGMDRYLTLFQKEKEFSEEIGKYKFLDGLFLYDLTRETYIGVKGEAVKNSEHTAVKKHAMEIISGFEGRENKNSWFFQKIEGFPYLLRVIETKNIYFCAWMKAEYLVKDLVEAEGNKDTFIALGDKKGEIMNCSETIEATIKNQKQIRIHEKKYSIINVFSNKRNLSLFLFQRDHSVFVVFKRLILPLSLIVVMGVTIYLLVIFFTKEVFLNPLDKILFEKERAQNKAELQFLQLQTNPHFLNNCLSLIRNLVFLDRKEEAQEAVISLGKYTRSSLNSKTEITVKGEIKHIATYYELLKLRFHNRIEIEVDVDPQTEFLNIPTMLIQTFVENSVKHQLDSEDTLRIVVRVFIEKKYLVVQIEDDGEGFEETLRSRLKEGKPIVDEDGAIHVGIANIVQRMHILYGENAKILFQNIEPHGASVTIFIPILCDVKKESGEKMERRKKCSEK